MTQYWECPEETATYTTRNAEITLNFPAPTYSKLTMVNTDKASPFF